MKNRDFRLAQLLQDSLELICPNANAVTPIMTTCPAGEMCESRIWTKLLADEPDPVSYPGDMGPVRYLDPGSTSVPGCQPNPGCNVSLTCQNWQIVAGASERSCVLTDSCFGRPNFCAPFNQKSFATSFNEPWTIKQRSMDTNPHGPGTAVCIPDCNHFDGGTETGLKYVWSGANAGSCACALGFVWNSATKKCVSPALMKGCDDGSGSSGIPSEVSPYITGTDYRARFHNARNRKLNCCLNGNPSNAALAKFDCFDNSVSGSSTFDDTWLSADPIDDGTNLNAIELFGPNGQPITGWYSVNGKRADQFSEFTKDSIQPGIIDSKVDYGQVQKIAGGIQAVGTPIPQPSPSAVWDEQVQLRGDKPAPRTLQEKRDFPILVRAAAVYHCPRNPLGYSPLRTAETVVSGTVTERRCAVADTVTIHIQIQQIWQVAGSPMMPKLDTKLEASQATTLSIDQLIVKKYGAECPPGSYRQGNACAW